MSNEENTNEKLKRTPLFDEHVKLGARIVPFAGWEMPVQYEGVKQEHMAVREKVGLFDVSHMGEIFVRGPKALETLQWLTSNDVSKLENGQAHYSLLPNANGGLVDDLIVYCIEKDQDYLLCVNAANIEKDYRHIVENNKGAEITNESSEWAQIAIQGPNGVELTSRVLGSDQSGIEYFKFAAVEYEGENCWLARTGYTGEDGFEIFLPNTVAQSFWQDLLEKGGDLGVKPIGLGARDTLRTEMKYSLYGHEITDETNPYMAGLGWVTKPQAKDFLGKEKILAEKEKGFDRKLMAFKVVDRGIARDGYLVKDKEGHEIGVVTSGTMSPSLNVGVGIAYLEKSQAEEGNEIFIDIRGRLVRAEAVKVVLTKK